MSTVRTASYEGMFLLAQSASADLAGAVAHLNDLFGRAGAEVLAMSKWDDRRFAYEIKKQKRGTYILAYFSCPTDQLVGLERDCNLSERILRAMIVTADHLTEEEMKSTDARQALDDEAAMRAREAAEQPASPEPVVTDAASAPASAEG